MKDITIYTTRYCGFCNQAKILLKRAKLPFKEIPVDDDQTTRQKLAQENNGYSTVPMIFIGGDFIGGFTELAGFLQSGKL